MCTKTLDYHYAELIVCNVRVTRSSAQNDEWLHPEERVYVMCGHCTDKLCHSLIQKKIEYTVYK